MKRERLGEREQRIMTKGTKTCLNLYSLELLHAAVVGERHGNSNSRVVAEGIVAQAGGDVVVTIGTELSKDAMAERERKM